MHLKKKLGASISWGFLLAIVDNISHHIIYDVSLILFSLRNLVTKPFLSSHPTCLSFYAFLCFHLRVALVRDF
jgi:hypothetical protein